MLTVTHHWLDHTVALVAEWKKNPAVRFQHLVESLKAEEWRMF